MKKIFIIAEIGINHCGSLNLAKKLIIEAKKSGAHAVKFQSYTTESLLREKAELMSYQKLNMGNKLSQFEMLKKCELSHSQQKILFDFCKKKKIEFISTPYDIENAKFLLSLGVKYIKIASTDTTNVPFLKDIIKLNKNILLSTGATSFKELNNIIKSIKLKKNKTTILHCISFYPANYSLLNLNVIKRYKEFFGFQTGFSDHSLSKISGALSVALGAKVIEKHLTLNRNLSGPDHKASLVPSEFREYVKNINECEIMLGDGIRTLSQTEKKIKLQMQKSIFVSKKLFKGDVVQKDDLIIMRPANSLQPIFFEKILGKKIIVNKKPLSKISINDFK